MKRNQGYSLVELIVVIAIMAVLTGTSVISVNMIGSFKAKECAKNIQSCINKTRVSTMGRNSVVLHLYQGADGSIYAQTTTNGTADEPQVIGKKSVTVRYTDGDDLGTATELDASGVYIEFDRSSGTMKLPSSGPSIYVHKIAVSQGNRTFVLTIYKETGKVVSE